MNARSHLTAALRTPAFAIVAVALFVTIFDNLPFWRAVLAYTLGDDHQIAIALPLCLVLFSSIAILLSLTPGARLLKLAGAALLLLSAVTSYFMSEYGVLIDPSIVRSAAETDFRETAPLLTGALAIHLLVFGVLPAAALLSAPLRRTGWRTGLATRLGVAGLSLAATVGAVHANYGQLSFFAHAHREVRLLMNPDYAIYSLVRVLIDAERIAGGGPRRVFADATRAAPDAAARPRLLVLVLGETARADRFSYNGYERETNRYTRERGVVNFGNVISCGTATADSIPCLFSHLGRAEFTHAAAAQHETVLGLLQRLGVHTYWRDNNTGCKNVCVPENYESLAAAADPELCADICFDEILLQDLKSRLPEHARDSLVVLHQRGSHGPAYFMNTPPFAKQYVPECDLANLRDCDGRLINNAYDNTILYTDYFLSSVIDFLERQADVYDVALLYVSDHGESLGEAGVYLHGLPYAIAPAEQKRIPMLFWASPGFYRHNGLAPACLRGNASREWSHDAIFHVLLAVFQVRSTAYDPELDTFAQCRGRDALRS